MPDDPSTPPPGDPAPTPDSPAPAPDPDDALGDAGKKALADERKARAAAERDAKAAKTELDKLRAASMSDQEKAVTAAREEGKNEALKDANARLVRAEIKIAAAGKLTDPDDAVRLLDSDEFVDDKGEVDGKKLASAIDDLLKTKPYLGAKGGRRADFDGGARTGAPAGGGSFLSEALKGRRT